MELLLALLDLGLERVSARDCRLVLGLDLGQLLSGLLQLFNNAFQLLRTVILQFI